MHIDILSLVLFSSILITLISAENFFKESLVADIHQVIGLQDARSSFYKKRETRKLSPCSSKSGQQPGHLLVNSSDKSYEHSTCNKNVYVYADVFSNANANTYTNRSSASHNTAVNNTYSSNSSDN